MSEANDVLRSIDQLRRDLSGYHGQLKAHNDLQRHCDNQRERIVELEGLYAKAKAENAELVEELSKWERLAASIDLPEYPVSQFVPKDLERENAKLRELARHLYACLSFCDREDEGRGCGFCPYRSVGEDCEFELRLLELGIEVDE